ncbi:mannitol operon repressor [Salmonella enterica subsp. enterica]|nr:mannitol operon repressor [Salmonella enterica subsp. enterica]
MTQNPAQVSLRPNNRLSDMQAIMEQTQAFENRVLERLNAGKTVRSFLITAVELLTEAVNILVLQVFRKDDYAVKYAVEPLLDGDGPLGDLSVRLKLIYGLGVLSRTEYEDAELLMALREELNHDGNEYAFTDDEILGRLANCTASWRYRRRRILIRPTRRYTPCKFSATSRRCVRRWSSL